MPLNPNPKPYQGNKLTSYFIPSVAQTLLPVVSTLFVFPLSPSANASVCITPSGGHTEVLVGKSFMGGSKRARQSSQSIVILPGGKGRSHCRLEHLSKN
jgi:hypothetical protein